MAASFHGSKRHRSLFHAVSRSPTFRRVLALTAGFAVFAVLWSSGWRDSTRDAFVEVGFDPDRGTLLAALAAGMIVPAIAALASGLRSFPALLGLMTVWAFFGATFVAETQSAMEELSSDVHFDLVGWFVTAVALSVAGLLVGGIAALVASEVRGSLLRTASFAAAALMAHRTRRLPWRRIAATTFTIIVVLVTGNALASMLNYSPDSLFVRGGAGPVPIFGGPSPAPDSSGGAPAGQDPGGGAPSDGGGSPGSPATGEVTPQPSGPVGSAGATAPPTEVPITGGSPSPSPSVSWTAHPPSGSGSVEITHLPAPWTGGWSTSAEVSVYVPPAYDSSGGQRYPVVYVVPWSLDYWEESMDLPAMLDQMIGSGRIPPEIFVFASQRGGPFVDCECVDSYDGHEEMDSYLAGTLVDWVDRSYRTLARSDARTVTGYSQGGFCAAELGLRHPDVFGNVIAFSGYYHAGVRNGQTVNAWRPFGNQAAMMAADSPILQAPLLDPAGREALHLVVQGGPDDPFYGPEFVAFTAELLQDGYDVTVLSDSHGHSWQVVRAQLSVALADVANRRTGWVQ
jgi:enterochelin esterase-like enzyme